MRQQLAAVIPEADHWLLFHEKGAVCPPLNHDSVMETYARFCSEFLPRCPIADPRGRQIRIRKDNFPKFLSLGVKVGFAPKKPSTIVELIEKAQFLESEGVGKG